MEIDSALQAAVRQVFGEMFFTYVESGGGGLPSVPDERFGVESEIGFEGPLTGRMRLILSRRLAEQMAANLMGQGAETLEERQVLDAAREAANVLCSSLLRLAGAGGSTISVPLARPFQDEEAGGLPGSSYDFEAEGEPLRVVLRLSDERQH